MCINIQVESPKSGHTSQGEETLVKEAEPSHEVRSLQESAPGGWR